MKVIRECLSLSDPILWRLSGGGIRKIKKNKKKKKKKRKSEEKNLGRNYKTSRPTDGMPKYQDNTRFPSLCLASKNEFLSYFYPKNSHNSAENDCTETKIYLCSEDYL